MSTSSSKMREVVDPPKPARMFIGGRWVAASSAATLPSVNPATEEVVGAIPDATPADVAEAVDAAVVVAPAWEAVGWERRARVLRELADRLAGNVEDLARIDTVDSGNPIRAMRDDVESASANVLYFAGIGPELKGSSLVSGKDVLSYTLREPYGVVGRIIPFNHPLKFAAAKIAAPLMAGNAVILKPSEQTSLSAIRLAEIAEDLFPSGVLSVVTGRGESAGSALVSDPRVPRIAFTGGVSSGRDVLETAAEHIKHVTLELGGKNPMIVFPDADPEAAANAAVKGMNLARSQGQSCGSNSRLFVHEKIKGRFVDALCRRVAALEVGDPLSEKTDMGPIAYKEHYERVMSYIELGLKEGAEALTGGGRAPGFDTGFFIAPTIFDRVEPHMRIAREEIFGPVVAVLSWRDYDDMIGHVNEVEYGLTANIWTNDLSVAQRTARLVQAGYVWINGAGEKPEGIPFGGYKASGLGKEGSLEELLSYTREKTVVVRET